MKNPITRFVKNERGVTALETAIILIAFVVVAAIFAFTILSTGSFLTERSKDAAYAGLSQVRGSLELKGSVVAKESATSTGKIDRVIFNLANVAGGTPIDFNTSNPVVAMKYRSAAEEVAVTGCWSKDSIGQDNGDNILEPGEVFQVTVDMGSSCSSAPSALPGANDTFSIEVIPPTGSTLVLQRTVPPKVDLVTDLH